MSNLDTTPAGVGECCCGVIVQPPARVAAKTNQAQRWTQHIVTQPDRLIRCAHPALRQHAAAYEPGAGRTANEQAVFELVFRLHAEFVEPPAYER